MTVKELITLLNRYDNDVIVNIEFPHHDWLEALELTGESSMNTTFNTLFLRGLHE